MGFDPIVLNGLGYLALLGAYFCRSHSFKEAQIGLVGVVRLYILTIILWVILGVKEFFRRYTA
jgi:hypothetical protein